ncbi:Serine/threonine-protein kinase PrkC [Stieleria neptunia]|uniref:Serine/threonine-protein kinase PrkC n=1 Tax=Stieleria neptunia TaxID=2527979 RepID=A0A518HRX0_9BACT|nr:serine/threonine-protein kinase [Stieleria neptunia]QDV43596.1 Serine/threonine-protein kinase PrkC [Stieleria neptunia]
MNDKQNHPAKEATGQPSSAGDRRLEELAPLVDGIDREQFFRQWMDSDLSRAPNHPASLQNQEDVGIEPAETAIEETIDPLAIPPQESSTVVLSVAIDETVQHRELLVPGQYVVGTDQSTDIQLPSDARAAGRCGCLILERGLALFVRYRESVTSLPDSLVLLGEGKSLRFGDCEMKIRLARDTAFDATLDQPPPPRPSLESPNASDVFAIRGYQIAERIGAGGNGTVYRAKQLGTNRTVAVKTLLPELVYRERSRQLFYREASIASQLDHPQIVSCLGFGIEKDTPYIVMEYVSSIPIQQVLDETADSRRVRLSLGLAIKMLAALEYAHHREIVHRDIKPSNLLAYKLKERLHIKLADFGLAKCYSTAGYSGITGSKDVCGTLPYMSPEQLCGSRDVGPTSDLYSVIVCLYEFLCGQLPHPATSAAELIQLKLETVPRSIQSLNPSVGFELSNLIERGLSRDPKKRIQTAGELSQALHAIRTGT